MPAIWKKSVLTVFSCCLFLTTFSLITLEKTYAADECSAVESFQVLENDNPLVPKLEAGLSTFTVKIDTVVTYTGKLQNCPNASADNVITIRTKADDGLPAAMPEYINVNLEKGGTFSPQDNVRFDAATPNGFYEIEIFDDEGPYPFVDNVSFRITVEEKQGVEAGTVDCDVPIPDNIVGLMAELGATGDTLHCPASCPLNKTTPYMCTSPTTQQTSCAFCSREEGFFYYDQPNNRCCKYYGCTIPQDLQEDIDQLREILSGEGGSTDVNQSTTLLNKVQEEQKNYIVPATDKKCSKNEYCIPGRGCSPKYPDPGKPPCAEGAFEEATGKCYTVQTAVAFVDTDPAGLVRSLLGILLSISGMIALYFIIRSGYQLMTSRGNPEAIQAAKERLTSAIVGLLFILFSLVILQVIGVDLLKIPGFGE